MKTPRAYELPQPKFAIGTRLEPKRLASPYTRGRLVKDLVKNTLGVLAGLRRKGYADQAKDGGKILGNHNKGRIRTMLRIMDEAHSAEIAGIRPSTYGHVVGSFSHPSYLEDGQSHGGVHYNYQILYRATIDGAELVFIPDMAVHSEHMIEGALIDYPAAPADDFVLPNPPLKAKDFADGTYFLQLAPDTEFVTYGYGIPDRYYHRPQHLRMNSAHLDTADIFELPETGIDGKPAIQLDRATLCGWQFVSNGYSGLGWRVARNKREALEHARAFAARIDRRSRHDDERRLTDALDQGRIVLRKSWDETMDDMIREHLAARGGGSKPAQP